MAGMGRLEEEAKAFGRTKTEEEDQARQRVALSLLCGIDIADTFTVSPERRAKLIRHIERLIERERLKGVRRHWGYDLNRHIALKQVLDRLCGRPARSASCRNRADGAIRRWTGKRKRRPKAP
jgi:hypothetical protein